jgi:hypothetical protein
MNHLPTALSLCMILGSLNGHLRVDAHETANPFAGRASGSSLSAAKGTLGRFESSFVENKGQAHASVLFYADAVGGQVSLLRRAVVFALHGHAETSSVASERVALEFVGANPDVRPVGRHRTETAVTVFRGQPDQWTRDIGTYAEVCYPDLWSGIDLVVRTGEAGPLKYEFVVAPGADPRSIRLAYRSAGAPTITDAGDIELRTPAGVLSERAPVCFQEAPSGRVDVSSAFRRTGSQGEFEFGFSLGAYDSSRPLVVDPEIVFSGLLAARGAENVADVALDASGNIYIVGSTTSPPEDGFPVVAGPGHTFYPNEGYHTDAFVAKLSSDGTRLIYCGYIAGSRWDRATGVAVDPQGNAYVYGTTYSNSTTEHFPVLLGPHLVINLGTETRNADVFLSKVSPDGTSLLYSGYVNAVLSEDSGDVAVDAQGNAYIIGIFRNVSYPPNLPRPNYVPCSDHKAESNGWIIKVSSDPTKILFMNWILGDGLDVPLGLAIDSAGSVYVTGMSSSPSICYLSKGPKLTPGGGGDAFVGKLKPDLTSFEYLGFIGGAEADIGTRVAVDSAGAAYVVGMTKSTESSFPVGGGPDLTFNGPPDGYDAFVAKVKPDGTGLVYCGYIGGNADEGATGVAVDSRGRAVVTGFTASTEATFPVANPIDATYNGGSGLGDAFVAQVAANGRGLDFSTYLGGTKTDVALAVELDPQGNAVVVGSTTSDDGSFPTTANSFNATPMGRSDVFVVKLSFGPPGPAPPSVTGAVREGKFLVVSGANFVAGAKVLVNGTEYKTKFTSATSVKSKKARKVVLAGDRVRVRNPDGQESNEVVFAG